LSNTFRQFYNILRAAFASISIQQKITNSNCKHIKAEKALLYLKNWPKNVGEIDTFSQFHQHFTSSFCANILLQKNYKAKL